MVKVTKFMKVVYPGNYMVELFSDTKDEVVPGMTVEGLPDNYIIELGSYVITADGDLGIIKSDGTWSWVEPEE